MDIYIKCAVYLEIFWQGRVQLAFSLCSLPRVLLDRWVAIKIRQVGREAMRKNPEETFYMFDQLGKSTSPIAILTEIFRLFTFRMNIFSRLNLTSSTSFFNHIRSLCLRCNTWFCRIYLVQLMFFHDKEIFFFFSSFWVPAYLSDNPETSPCLYSERLVSNCQNQSGFYIIIKIPVV